jgi:NTE family protein
MDQLSERVGEIEELVIAARRMARATLRQFLEGATEVVRADAETLTVTALDLRRYASEWSWLAPSEPGTRTVLDAALAERFGGSASEPASETAVDVLEQASECVAIKGGETFLRQGESSTDLYIVLSGRLAAAEATPAGERVLREMGRGTTIGELAALTGQPRAARVFAVRDWHVLRVPHAAFERAMARFPEVLRGIVLTLMARVREGSHGARRPPTRTLAILPIHASVRADAFARQLAHALTRYGATRLVTPADAAANATGTLSQGWLDGLEETNRFVVYVADTEASGWTARCIRQAVASAEPAAETGRALTQGIDRIEAVHERLQLRRVQWRDHPSHVEHGEVVAARGTGWHAAIRAPSCLYVKTR